MAAFQDPEVAAAFQDISVNPANLLKYQSNPKIMALVTKLSSKFVGSGFPAGGFPAGFPGAGAFPKPPKGPAGAPDDDGLDWTAVDWSIETCKAEDSFRYVAYYVGMFLSCVECKWGFFFVIKLVVLVFLFFALKKGIIRFLFV